jgi:hypothetical protein
MRLAAMKQIEPLGALKNLAYSEMTMSVSVTIQLCYGSRDSPVNTMIGYGLDNKGSIPDRGK